MARSRPLGVTLLAIFALLAGLVAGYHMLQMLHILPVRLFGGAVRFFTFDIFGAILWGIMLLIYLWVFRMLWNLDPQGWTFVTVLAVLNLILAFLSIFGATTWQEMLPSLLINGLILIYALLPGTKAAFGVPNR
ncbi:MAG: hypothetical protein WAU00_11925 [Caldilinea sp.]|uniref:hypothetical protein n=1 Tax=Caldilinea sp. TaxID=2293560 RepID=UPI002CA7DA76|nr:hypothetical protein [Anaerolineales bacterium]HQY92055.1 hypothetical protein [Caldilinea sp.]